MNDYSKYLKNLFRWQSGRQNPHYKKMFIFGNPFIVPFDIYLLKFEPGSEIQPHTDQVDSGRHFRLNLIVRHPKEGGDFHCDETIYESRSLKIFRPDISEHSVSQILAGTRYVVSIGWVLRDRSAAA